MGNLWPSRCCWISHYPWSLAMLAWAEESWSPTTLEGPQFPIPALNGSDNVHLSSGLPWYYQILCWKTNFSHGVLKHLLGLSVLLTTKTEKKIIILQASLRFAFVYCFCPSRWNSGRSLVEEGGRKKAGHIPEGYVLPPQLKEACF